MGGAGAPQIEIENQAQVVDVLNRCVGIDDDRVRVIPDALAWVVHVA